MGDVKLGSECIKQAIPSKRLKIRAKVNGLYKVVHGLSITPHMYDLAGPQPEFFLGVPYLPSLPFPSP